tara:strand:+ start:4695 stop:4895 length:201 start_codon:yes stop_codon:yes gene_type:complete
MWQSLLCIFKGHDLHVAHRYNAHCARIVCQRCRLEFYSHEGLDMALPWTPERAAYLDAMERDKPCD